MLFNLDIAPSGDDAFDWADFVELRAITHPDKCFSRGDLAGLLNRAKDRSERPGADTVASDDGVAVVTEGLDEADGKKTAPTTEARWRDAINFVNERSTMFGDDYPFTISADKDTVSLRADLPEGAWLYLTLLIGASMRYIPQNRRSQVAREFEERSLSIFEKLMPEGMEVRAAWARGGKDAPYSGTLFDKLTAIASDIRATPLFCKQDFKPQDRGDGGIDIVAWHPMADTRQGIPIALAQCGCSRDDWRHKQLEASPAKLQPQMAVMHPWSNYYFMPQDLRWKHGDWAYKHDFGQAIVVDRLRIIRLARQYNIIHAMERPAFIREVLEMREA